MTLAVATSSRTLGLERYLPLQFGEQIPPWATSYSMQKTEYTR